MPDTDYRSAYRAAIDAIIAVSPYDGAALLLRSDADTKPLDHINGHAIDLLSRANAIALALDAASRTRPDLLALAEQARADDEALRVIVRDHWRERYAARPVVATGSAPR